MNIASFASGFAAGAFLCSIIFLLAAGMLAAAAWRFAGAIERAGFDLHLKPTKVTEHP
jgi:hypothetical protein